jgi:transposase-like protein
VSMRNKWLRQIRRKQERTLRSLVRMENDYQRSITRLLEVSHGIKCKWCGSTNYVHFGHYQQSQRYMCRDCGRKFREIDTYPHMWYSRDVVEAALSAVTSGMTLRETCQLLKDRYGISPANSTVCRWVSRYRTIAVSRIKE